ncbi:response regulator transcription factor [Kribbella sp. CCNWLY201]|uniref:response regulator transcription factor n=1 Tax=unclassified Kribbella TaxID=2644121 RepID=UPI003FA52533
MRCHPWLQAPSPAPGPNGTTEGSRDQSLALVGTDALTSKEYEVLEYLAELLTTEEIASTMYVSVNTVRSHVRSVLRKPNASRRNESVRRAWELGGSPPHARNPNDLSGWTPRARPWSASHDRGPSAPRSPGCPQRS